MAWAVSSPHPAPWKLRSRGMEGRTPGPGRRAHGSSYSPEGWPKTDRSRFEGSVLLDLRVAALGPCLPSPPTTKVQAPLRLPGTLLCPQGTYVLQDNSFPLLVRMASGLQYLEEAPKVPGGTLARGGGLFPSPGPWEREADPLHPAVNPQARVAPGCWPPPAPPTVTRVPRPQFLAFTCGLLRGTLSTLGVKSLVTASVAALPACELGWGGSHPSSVPGGPPCSQGPQRWGWAAQPHCRWESMAQRAEVPGPGHTAGAAHPWPCPRCPPRLPPWACQPGGESQGQGPGLVVSNTLPSVRTQVDTIGVTWVKAGCWAEGLQRQPV